MKIITLGHKTLAKKAEPVKNIDKTLKKHVEEMFKVLDSANGVGLAAPQVDISKRFFIVNIKEENFRLVCINPEIVSLQNSFETREEGCLSIPGIYAPVSRSRKVKLKFTDLDGVEHIMKAEDLLARIFQHECDHLDGRLFVDLVDKENLRKIEDELSLIRGKKT
jgi:peptide deformylase